MDRDEIAAMARRIYAKQVAHAAVADDPRLEAALGAVPRERFLPPGPWLLSRWSSGYQATPDDDPVFVYQDVPVAIDPERHLNNGQPSFITGLIVRGRPRFGDTVVHVGAGTGYFSAVLGHLVGPSGHVLGIEHDAALASRAAGTLEYMPQVRIMAGDGGTMPLPAADLVFVNAGAARPADTWLDALKPGGRLILPLTAEAIGPDTSITRGVVFLIERRTGDSYAARSISPTMIYPCAGARDPEATAALAKALAAGGQDRVTVLRRTGTLDEERCWLHGQGWCLAYA